MKINEILRMSSEILKLDLTDETFDGAMPNNALVKILLNSCNFVYEELYRDYATAIRKTTVEVVDGFVDTTMFRMCKVISLVDAEGNDVNFRYGEGGLHAADGRYNLTYARLPEVLGWGDEVLLPSPRITERILVYGTVREYYAVMGDWANAQQWDARFKDALQVAGVKTSSMRMPVGRWL